MCYHIKNRKPIYRL